MRELSAEKLARMTPENRKKYEAKLRRVKRNRKILAFAVGFIVAAVVIVVLCTVVLFNISTINVKTPGTYYTAQEIISASGIDVGDNMIVTDFDKAAERVTKNLPYIKSVTFKKTLSGAVSVSVTDAEPKFIVTCAGGFAVADDNLKALELVAQVPEDSALIELVAAKAPTAKVGENLSFENNENETFANLLEKANKSGITGITKINVSDATDISIDVQSRLRLKLGDISDLDYKLKSAAEVIKSENELSEDTVAEINLTVKGKVYVDPVSELD